MPSLVVLDDLHLLCPAPSQAPEAALANIGSAALIAWLRDVLKEYHAHPDGRPPLPGKPLESLPPMKSLGAPGSQHALRFSSLGKGKLVACCSHAWVHVTKGMPACEIVGA